MVAQTNLAELTQRDKFLINSIRSGVRVPEEDRERLRPYWEERAAPVVPINPAIQVENQAAPARMPERPKHHADLYVGGRVARKVTVHFAPEIDPDTGEEIGAARAPLTIKIPKVTVATAPRVGWYENRITEQYQTLNETQTEEAMDAAASRLYDLQFGMIRYLLPSLPEEVFRDLELDSFEELAQEALAETRAIMRGREERRLAQEAERLGLTPEQYRAALLRKEREALGVAEADQNPT